MEGEIISLHRQRISGFQIAFKYGRLPGLAFGQGEPRLERDAEIKQRQM